ncbi:MAG: chemoreceptor glutamine deamidase CheD [Oceanospirillaceae bacterium]|nr:chemoreceptor glutamine deamidase CheD [Oceanospirillaceae bacterium]MCP5350078.1 chemoreceptor glutamine deamidase CheD [Oceanospirillaceae bacterium]
MIDRPPLQPPCPRGFEHINRYWDERHQVWAAKILPGEFYVTAHGEMIGTVLGSCISVCIRDVVLGIGGMNHFMLPAKENLEDISWGSNQTTAATRYGNWAMEYMLNELYKLGALKQNLEVKVFGGGQVLASMTDIGQNNILFAYDYLHREGMQIKAADVGDIFSRKVLYFPDTGAVKVRRITNTRNDTVVVREKDYAERARNRITGSNNNIELFD